jgi:riboflavin biosynthesis pyrimidine reductase
MLLPGRADVGDLYGDREAAIEALADLYAYPDPLPGAGWVRANMISTLDGSATGDDGLSGTLGGAADRAVFGVLRGLADVILVGAGTVRSEGYGPPAAKPEFAERRMAAGQAEAPVLAIVTRSGRLPSDAGLFSGPTPSYVITTASADTAGLRAIAGGDRVVVGGETELDLHDAVKVLAGRGLRRVLLEGGPQLLAAALAAGRVDELCLTWSPVLVGGEGPRIAVGPASRCRARPAHLIAADDVLLGRWMLQPGPDT